MTHYAKVINGIVSEIIPPFFKTEEMRPPKPADLPENATGDQRSAYAEALAEHESFQVGEVLIAERFTPDFVADLVALPEGSHVDQGYTYADGVFGPPPPPPATTAAQALAARDSLLAIAALRIAPLQDAVDIDEASAAEVALLKKWKQYRVALNRVAEQPGFPANVQWPEQPQ